MLSLPADSINVAAAQLPVLLVAARFGADSAGLLAMALRMLGAPMSLLSASVLDVFKRHAGQAYLDRSECRSEFLHAFLILASISLVAGISLAVGIKPFFVFAFGDAWLGAGAMALWLLPRFIIGFVASPMSYMTYIAGKQHLDLMWQLALLAMTFFTLSFASSIQITLVSYGFGYSALYLVYLVMSYRFSLGKIS
jgi:O-antigen/teichoic acid export membrane protein